MSDPRYCHKCEAYINGKPRTHDGNSYCQKCYEALYVAEESVFTPELVERAVVAPIGKSAPTTRCDDVCIPLDLQKRLLKTSFYYTLQWLEELLDDEDFVDDLEQMALARLEEAHPKWGSTMYTWNDSRRFRAIMEELADVFVYKSSES